MGLEIGKKALDIKEAGADAIKVSDLKRKICNYRCS